MKYLLDVNALVAFGHTEHQFYVRVAIWAAEIAKNDIPKFLISSITELGFVRVMSQAYGVSISQAQVLLRGLKESEQYEFAFLADDHDVSSLPAWVSDVNSSCSYVLPNTLTHGQFAKSLTASSMVKMQLLTFMINPIRSDSNCIHNTINADRSTTSPLLQMLFNDLRHILRLDLAVHCAVGIEHDGGADGAETDGAVR